MLNETYGLVEKKMKQTVDHLRAELKTLRTGKASLAILDSVKVDYYGTPSPLSQVCTLSIPDATLITATPWESSMIKEIEKAIMNAGLGLTPGNDGKIVRIPIPALNEERRKEIVKKAREYSEQTKVAIRQIRHEGRDQVDSLEKDKEISEDDKHRGHDKIQEFHDTFIKDIEEIIKHKEKEVMEV